MAGILHCLHLFFSPQIGDFFKQAAKVAGISRYYEEAAGSHGFNGRFDALFRHIEQAGKVFEFQVILALLLKIETGQQDQDVVAA
jgi:hypothetical protein